METPSRWSTIDAQELAPAIVSGFTVGALGLAGGGYRAPTWGWATLARVAWSAAGWGAPADLLRLGRLELVFLGGLVGLGVWTLVSAGWTPIDAQAVLESERLLLYIVGSLALLARCQTLFLALSARRSADRDHRHLRDGPVHPALPGLGAFGRSRVLGGSAGGPSSSPSRSGTRMRSGRWPPSGLLSRSASPPAPRRSPARRSPRPHFPSWPRLSISPSVAQHGSRWVRGWQPRSSWIRAACNWSPPCSCWLLPPR